MSLILNFFRRRQTKNNWINPFCSLQDQLIITINLLLLKSLSTLNALIWQLNNIIVFMWRENVKVVPFYWKKYSMKFHPIEQNTRWNVFLKHKMKKISTRIFSVYLISLLRERSILLIKMVLYTIFIERNSP